MNGESHPDNGHRLKRHADLEDTHSADARCKTGTVCGRQERSRGESEQEHTCLQRRVLEGALHEEREHIEQAEFPKAHDCGDDVSITE